MAFSAFSVATFASFVSASFVSASLFSRFACPFGHSDSFAMRARSCSDPTETLAYPTGGACQKVAVASGSPIHSLAAATASFTEFFFSHPSASGPRSSVAPTTKTLPTFSMPWLAQVYM